jgi:2-keto-4-pentenoate hydratase/2-oxohepta-3-ene-1,7-dioic acid hydratase in catechol pathway
MPHISFTDGTQQAVQTIYCIGRNYAKHAIELKNAVPDEPVVFLKPAASIIQHQESIVIPRQSNDVHHEVELVLCIGKKTKNVSRKAALSYINGVGIGIDVTARDLQSKSKKAGKPWSIAKGFDTFAPVSSFQKTDSSTTYHQTEVELFVNDELRQSGNTKDMLFPVPFLIQYLSEIFTLYPGDLIFTGTPEGVGPIQPGDVLRATLNNPKSELEVSVS